MNRCLSSLTLWSGLRHSLSLVALGVLVNMASGAMRSDSTQVGSFQNATALSVDQMGNLYVLDGGRNELLKLSPRGNVLNRVGGYGWSENEFDHPTDVTSPNGLDVYVTDYGNHRVQRFDRNLNLVTTFPPPSNNGPDRMFGYPISAAVSRLGALFVIDRDNRRVLKVGNGNMIERTFGDISSGRGRVIDPKRLRVSDDDIVYVQDGNHIVLFDVFGNYLRTIGDDVFHLLKTFIVDHQTLYVLDTCAIFSVDSTGSMNRILNMNEHLAVGETCDSVVDLAVRDGIIFLLSKHRVRAVRLPSSGDQSGNK